MPYHTQLTSLTKTTTLWDGQPVLGFMAETYLDDLDTIGVKDFNPMWSFPTTSVNQNWEPMTFGMAPWHLSEDIEKSKSKEAMQSQSPIAAFKACNVIQAIGIAYSKIVLPSGDSKGESKNRTYCPTTWNNSYTWQYAAEYADQLRRDSRASALLCKECTTIGANPAQQEECQSSKLRICRLSKHRHVWCNDQLDSMHCPYC